MPVFLNGSKQKKKKKKKAKKKKKELSFIISQVMQYICNIFNESS